MAIATGSHKLDTKMVELKSLQRSLASARTGPKKRRRQNARLPRLQSEIRRLLSH